MPEEKTKNIYQRIIEVQKKVTSVVKDDKISMGGETYSAVTHDMVTSVLHMPLADAGIVAVPTQVSCAFSEFETTKPGWKPNDPPKVTRWYRADVHAKVTFVNADDPKDTFESQAFSMALDTSDKAAAKAYSLALKSIHLKTFFLESKDKEEDRQFERMNEYQDQNQSAPREKKASSPAKAPPAKAPAPAAPKPASKPPDPFPPDVPDYIPEDKPSAKPPPLDPVKQPAGHEAAAGLPPEEPEGLKFSRMIYAVAAKKKWPKDDVGRVMRDAFGLASSKDITWVQANEMKGLMEMGLHPDEVIERIRLKHDTGAKK